MHLLNRRGLLVVGAAACAGKFLGGCEMNPVTGQRELSLISTSQEVAMGQQAAPQFEQQFGGAVPDASVQQYVTAVGQKVAGVCDRKDITYEFKLVRSATPNAFALPGGKIFVTAGLMARMGNERQLAAVLGHELGHANARHNVKGMQRQMGVDAFGQLATKMAGESLASKATAEGAKVVASMVTLKYGRDDEYQADTLGITYMSRAAYNPHGMIELLDTLLAMYDKEPSGLEEMFQTHPLTRKRIAEAKDVIAKNHPSAQPGQPDPNTETFVGMRTKAVSYMAKTT